MCVCVTGGLCRRLKVQQQVRACEGGGGSVGANVRTGRHVLFALDVALWMNNGGYDETHLFRSDSNSLHGGHVHNAL